MPAFHSPKLSLSLSLSLLPCFLRALLGKWNSESERRGMPIGNKQRRNAFTRPLRIGETIRQRRVIHKKSYFCREKRDKSKISLRCTGSLFLPQNMLHLARKHTVKIRNLNISCPCAGETRMIPPLESPDWSLSLPRYHFEISNNFRNLVQHLRRCEFPFDPSRDQRGKRVEHTSATFRVKGVAVLALRPFAQPLGRPILSIRVLVVFLPGTGRPGIPRNSRTWSPTWKIIAVSSQARARALVADDDGGGGNGRRNIGKSCGNMIIGKSTLGVARCAVY